MSKIHGIVDALIGLRKLFFAIGGIAFIGVALVVVLGVFIANWYLGTTVISGDNLKDIIVAAFQYTAAIAASYLAVNVANKWVSSWIATKKRK